MNTTEKNKIFAEFLGQKGTIAEFPQFGYMTSSGNWKDYFLANELKFHKDWNWLMEVVEKIESLELDKLSFNFQINKDKTSLFYTHKSELKKQTEMFFEWGQKTKIDNVYKITFDFIKWYNSQEAKETKDLFKFYDEQPENIKSILAHFGDLEALTYEQCREMLLNLETIGYTFEFGTDAVPYNLRKI